MLRIWVLAVALAVGCSIVMLGVGFFGAETLKFSAVAVGAAAAAAYLPGGVALSRAVYLLVGIFIGALGFVIGAVALSDNNLGVYLGGIIPFFIAALVGMWSRKPEAYLTIVLGVGAFSGAYTTTFFTDPQSLNYSMPITIGGTILNVGLGYFLACLVRVFYPVGDKDVDTTSDSVNPSSDGDNPTQSLDIVTGQTNETDASQAGGATDSASEVPKTTQEAASEKSEVAAK